MNSPIDNLKIIEQLIARRSSAWKEFVASYQRLVYSRVKATAEQCRFELDSSEVEDICAEVFASLLADEMRTLKSFQGRSRISTWLSVIARRVCLRELNRIRQRRTHAIGSGNGWAKLENAKQDRSPDLLNQLIRDEQRDQIQTTLRNMRQADRELLEMYFNERLSYEEISRRAGISINSVGPKLNRSVSRLRKLLGWN